MEYLISPAALVQRVGNLRDRLMSYSGVDHPRTLEGKEQQRRKKHVKFLLDTFVHDLSVHSLYKNPPDETPRSAGVYLQREAQDTYIHNLHNYLTEWTTDFQVDGGETAPHKARLFTSEVLQSLHRRALFSHAKETPYSSSQRKVLLYNLAQSGNNTLMIGADYSRRLGEINLSHDWVIQAALAVRSNITHPDVLRLATLFSLPTLPDDLKRREIAQLSP